MLTDAFLSRLDALRLSMKDEARGGAGGLRRSRNLGISAEFSDFREYVPGDDVRRLDWNAYARFDKLFMKLFIEEQEAMVTVMVDGSASMAAKRATGIQLAEALSYLALNGGDRLRIAWLEEGGAYLSPLLSGRSAYARASAFLQERQMAGRVDLMASIRRIDPLPRGMCMLISDGYLESGLGPVLDLLRYRRQQCAFFHVLSPMEAQPQPWGAVRLKDAEGAADLEVVVDAAALRRYQKALQAFQAQLRQCCHERGVPMLEFVQAVPFEEAFFIQMGRSGLIL